MAKEMEKLRHRIIIMHINKRIDLLEADDVEGFKSFQDNEKGIFELITATNNDISCIFRLSERLHKSNNLSSRELVLISLFTYLLTAEGILANFLNYISYLLVATGHDLFSLTKRQYVKADINDIRKVEMSTKIQFLKYHGFDALVKEYDSTFRNDIAHHNYKIDEQGVLLIRGKPVDLESKLTTMTKMCKFVIECMQAREELARDIEKQVKKLKKK
jgi:hypothetical protein